MIHYPKWSEVSDYTRRYHRRGGDSLTTVEGSQLVTRPRKTVASLFLHPINLDDGISPEPPPVLNLSMYTRAACIGFGPSHVARLHDRRRLQTPCPPPCRCRQLTCSGARRFPMYSALI
eukprot:Selendium_serpulae@DN7278_c0_g1_i1.p1